MPLGIGLTVLGLVSSYRPEAESLLEVSHVRAQGGAKGPLQFEIPDTFLPGEQVQITAFSDLHGNALRALPQSKTSRPFYVNDGDNFEDFYESRVREQIDSEESEGSDVIMFLGDASTINYNAKSEDEMCADDARASLARFLEWFDKLSKEKYPIKIVIPGNHDACYYEEATPDHTVDSQSHLGVGKTFVGWMEEKGIHFIRSTTAVEVSKKGLAAVKLLFSPYSEARRTGLMGTNQYRPQGVQTAGELSYETVLSEMAVAAEQLHNKIDVFISHGPPDNIGSKYATDGSMVPLIKSLQPEFVLFGHIHISGELPMLKQQELYMSNIVKGAAPAKDAGSGLVLDVAMKMNRPEQREPDKFDHHFFPRFEKNKGASVTAYVPVTNYIDPEALQFLEEFWKNTAQEEALQAPEIVHAPPVELLKEMEEMREGAKIPEEQPSVPEDELPED